MRICATSSTFVITIATFVVNKTLLIRCPLIAVMVKKFSPDAPRAKVPAVCHSVIFSYRESDLAGGRCVNVQD